MQKRFLFFLLPALLLAGGCGRPEPSKPVPPRPAAAVSDESEEIPPEPEPQEPSDVEGGSFEW